MSLASMKMVFMVMGFLFLPSNPRLSCLTHAVATMGLVITRFVGKVQGLESGLETGVTGASPPTVTSMGSSFYLGGQIQGRRP